MTNEENIKIVSLESTLDEMQNKKYVKILYCNQHFVMAESISAGADNVFKKLPNNVFYMIGCKQVSFTLADDAFSYYSVEDGDRRLDPCRYIIEAGSNTFDIKQNCEISMAK